MSNGRAKPDNELGSAGLLLACLLLGIFLIPGFPEFLASDNYEALDYLTATFLFLGVLVGVVAVLDGP